MVGNLQSATGELHGFGSKRRTEHYEVELNFMTIKANDNPSRAEERAVALGDAVQDALQNDPLVGSTAIKACYVAEYELTTFPHDKGWMSIYTLTLDVLARSTAS